MMLWLLSVLLVGCALYLGVLVATQLVIHHRQKRHVAEIARRVARMLRAEVATGRHSLREDHHV